MGCIRLVSFSLHSIYFDTDGEAYSHPLSGTIHLSLNPTDLLSLQVSLIQTLILDKPSCDLQSRKKRKQRLQNGKVSLVTEIAKSNLSTIPLPQAAQSNNSSPQLEFTILIPCDIPETIHTPSTVSYELMASASCTDNQTLTDRRSLHLSRLKIHDLWSDITHVRSFPDSRLQAEFSLRPQMEVPRVISAEIWLRHVATPGPRPSELSITVVEELQWTVTEIEEWILEGGDKLTHRRKVARGEHQGRWGGIKAHNQEVEYHLTDATISIPWKIVLDDHTR